MAYHIKDVRMPLLELQYLSKSYGSTHALADARLSIEKGEIVALMGANGAGKSTLVKILAGAETPDHGEMLWKGQAYRPRNPAEAAGAGVVTVHQSTDVVGAPDQTVADALLLDSFARGRQPFFLSKASVRKAAAEILRDTQIDVPLDAQFSELGTADRQLVAIARALHGKAELLILDEPTASLSISESKRLYEFLLSLKAKGIAILYISHRTADLKALADRVEILRGGRNVGHFERPIDFEKAIETMIGRSLAEAQPEPRSDFGDVVFQIEGARLVDGSPAFDLVIRRGEVVAISGVLGSGKSRLLSAIFGTGHLAAGTMRLEGRPYRPNGPQSAIDAGVAMAAEDRRASSLMPADWPGESIAGTVSLPHLRKWYPSGFLFSGRETREAERQIERIGIKAPNASVSVWSLSGGNQQKCVLARWEAEPSSLLLLDEPFQGVDVGARQDIINTIRSRRDGGTLIATSDPEEAHAVADRVLIMDRHTILETEAGLEPA
jgi:simple sugar transport system ATP-binding protein